MTAGSVAHDGQLEVAVPHEEHGALVPQDEHPLLHGE